jgi:hypothetical protein
MRTSSSPRRPALAFYVPPVNTPLAWPPSDLFDSQPDFGFHIVRAIDRKLTFLVAHTM